MMETTASAIGDHRRWLRHGAMGIGSTWSEDGSRSRALQGDGNMQMGVGRYGKNSRATHVSRDKATRAVVYPRGVPDSLCPRLVSAVALHQSFSLCPHGVHLLCHLVSASIQRSGIALGELASPGPCCPHFRRLVSRPGSGTGPPLA